MKLLAFAPRYNKKRKDATGVFQPEARRFLEYHHSSVSNLVLVDNRKTKGQMRSQVLDVLGNYDRYLDGVFFFCHGYKKGIQLGFDLHSVQRLSDAIAKASHNNSPIICLYACDTGRDLDKDQFDDLEGFGGDGGFADELRDGLCRAGAIHCRTVAHTTAGHATKNPNVRLFEGHGSSVGGLGGFYIIPFRSKWWKAWRAALRTDFRFAFPFMTMKDITEHFTK